MDQQAHRRISASSSLSTADALSLRRMQSKTCSEGVTLMA